MMLRFEIKMIENNNERLVTQKDQRVEVDIVGVII